MAKPARGRPSNAARAAKLNGGTVEQSGPNDSGAGGASSGDGDNTIDPAALAGQPDAIAGTGGNDDLAGRRGRSDAGKPRGPRKKSAPLDLSDLKDIILMAHAGLAVVFGEKLILADEEGEKLAGAAQKVLRHYDMPDIASETKDWIGLIMVAGTIYGTRIAAVMAEKATVPKPQTAREADNGVTLFPGTRNTPGPTL